MRYYALICVTTPFKGVITLSIGVILPLNSVSLLSKRAIWTYMLRYHAFYPRCIAFYTRYYAINFSRYFVLKLLTSYYDFLKNIILVNLSRSYSLLYKIAGRQQLFKLILCTLFYCDIFLVLQCMISIPEILFFLFTCFLSVNLFLYRIFFLFTLFNETKESVSKGLMITCRLIFYIQKPTKLTLFTSSHG